MNHLVLQSFGRENEYKRAILTILSYYAQVGLQAEEAKVLLFTDNPSYFREYLDSIPVEFVLLTPEKIQMMRGNIDFLHRIKIAAIEEAFEITDGNLLYADSDTFFIADPTQLIKQLSERNAFMHLVEYPFIAETDDKTETYRSFYELINKQSFKLSNGKEIKVTSQHNSWNAGVMFFHPSHKRLMPDVYALTEQFYPGSGSHASEQYAFSVIMQENTIVSPCEHVIYHYWYRIKKQITDSFLEKKLKVGWESKTLQEKLREVKIWTQELPWYFQHHEWTMKDNAIQAFNRNDFTEGYKWAVKSLLKKPFNNAPFIKDVIYHIKRHISTK